jgi:hypothetical protein
MSAIALPLSHSALAGTDSWIGAAGGNWTDANQWSKAAPPGNGDDVSITPAFSDTQTISYDYSGATITLKSLTLDASGGGTSVLSLTTNTFATSDSVKIGYNGSALLNQAGGTNTVTGSTSAFYIGYNAASTGTYALSAGTFTGVNIEYLGYNGSGIFKQSGGIHTLDGFAPVLYIGFGAGSTGTYQLSGGTLSGSNTEELGLSGVGNFNQSGGTNDFGAFLTIGSESGSTGNYTLSAGMLTGSGEEVGTLGSGHFNQSGGTNTSTNENSFQIGLAVSSTGSYTLSAGTLSNFNLEQVGYLGSGTFNQSGGFNTLAGNDSTLYISYESGSTGAYLLSGGTLSNLQSEYIGYSDAGTFNQSGGTNTLTNNLVVNFSGGSTSTYLLSDGILAANVEIIGTNNSGVFNQSGGTNSLAGSSRIVYLGLNSRSTGTYVLSGGQISASHFYVGGLSDTSGGKGIFAVSGPGNFNVTGDLQIFGTGSVTISGSIASAALDTVGSLHIATGGLLTLNGSALTVAYGTAASPNSIIRGYISTGYNAGGSLWTGTTGINSSSAAADPAHHSVAFADGTDGIVTNLPAGISSAIPNGGVLPAGTELVTYAYAGDGNLDGKVDFNDFVLISTHFLQPDINWDHGNYNYDGVVDFNDFVVLSTNFGEGVMGGDGASATPQQLAQYNAMAESFGISAAQIKSWDATIATLPEPGSIGLLTVGALVLLRRRRDLSVKSFR